VTVDLKTALKNKKLLYGVGLAAAAGGAVLWTKSKGGGSSSAGGGQAATQPAYVGAGSVDTTGTDVASWLGNYSSSLQAQYDQQQQQWAEFGKNLTDSLTQMSNGVDTTGFREVSLEDGSWLTNVLQGTGLSLDQLLKYNPNVVLAQSDAEGWVGPNNPATGSSLRLAFKGAQKIKVPN
jgi:hypothetical protein